MSYFIQRKYINDTTHEQSTFKSLLNNNISIILGEPASGKTYQLENYKKLNPQKSIFVELLFIDDDEQMNEEIDVVLLDSIDEALSKNDSDKALTRKLSKYIKKCKEINPNVKFIVTCRYVEWKEIFEEELKNIDKDLKIFYIEELSKENIDDILKQKSVNENEFLEFIKQNYLEQLLKNILMVIYLIDNFDKYKGKSLKYFEIYQEIVKEHLTVETDNERKSQLLKLSPNKMFDISSTIATYMMLNRKRTIPIDNINRLARELYKLNDIEITGEDLNIVFDTALFSGNRENTRFFHKSIQEYLTAYFINKKKLDIPTIKNIFAYNYGFYEEFEEVIIYLTNIESKFFKYFVDFDPLIFRRHPYLSKEEQTILLVSMLNILQKDRQKAWGKWEYIEDSSLVKLYLVDNIDEYVRRNIEINDVDIELFVYIVSLLEHNYSVELEDIIFEILENIKINKRLCIRYINMHHIENLNYNKRLFQFIKNNDMIVYKEKHLYFHIFDVLYKHVKFKSLKILIQHFSLYDKNKLKKIEIEDILVWINEIFNTYDRNNRKYSDEQISFLIFKILESYKTLEDKSILNTIVKFVENNLIYIRFNISDYEKEEYILDFNDIKNDFWNYFFNQKLDNRRIRSILDFMPFYDVSAKDIEEVSHRYSIGKYKEYYLYFRTRINNIDDLLMKNNEFKVYFEKLRRRHLKQEEEWRDRDWEREQKEKEEEKIDIYNQAVSSLKTREDILNIYFTAKEKSDKGNKTYNKLTNDLGDKYILFIDLIKSEFENDQIYINYEKNILDSGVYDSTNLFNYLFSNISNNEIDELIQSQNNFRKLFWHTLRYHKLSKEYFIYSSKQHLNYLVSIITEIINNSLIECCHEDSFFLSQIIHLLKKLEIFNKKSLEQLVNKLKEIDTNSYINLGKNKEYLIEILAVDDNYELIKEILLKDLEHFNIYFEYLFMIDINCAFHDFIALIYPKGNSTLIFYVNVKVGFLKPVYQFNKFDVLIVNPNHREKFLNLMSILYKANYTNKLTDDNLKFILENYFNFFHEYYHANGNITRIYDHMNKTINNILNSLGEDTSKISLLEELKNSPNIKLQTRIKRQLEIAYNLQLKNREDGKDYKNILDEFVSGESDNRFFNYEKLKNDLIEISLILMESRKSIFNEIEDLINDRFRDALKLKSYRIADQSRGGESQTGKSVGERDLVVQNKESGVAESGIEAFILESDTASIINEHYEKLINKYDTSGNKCNFILAYSKVKDFETLWNKYQIHFSDFTVEDTKKDNLKVGLTKKADMQIVHLFINFYSESIDIKDSNNK